MKATICNHNYKAEKFAMQCCPAKGEINEDNYNFDCNSFSSPPQQHRSVAQRAELCVFYTPTFFVPLENNVVQEVVSNYNISGNLSLFARIGVQPAASNVS